MKSDNQDVFPCIDCITFAICKAEYANRYYELAEDHDSVSVYANYPVIVSFYNTLYDKCSLIQSYYLSTNQNIKDNLYETFIKPED